MARIVFLGDSLTWGQYGGDFVAHVAEAMPEHTIVNSGVGGDTVVNLWRRLENVIDEHHPDTIFVMIGGNDAVTSTMPATRAYYRQAKGLEDGIVTIETFERTYRNLLTHIQLEHIQPLVGLAGTEYNKTLITARNHYNDCAREIAHSLRIPILDLAAKFPVDEPVERDPVDMGFILRIGENVRTGYNDFESERARWGYRYTFDGMHLLPETARQYAEHTIAFLREHVTTP